MPTPKYILWMVIAAVVFAISPLLGWWLFPEVVGLIWEGCTHPQTWQLWTRRNWTYHQPLFWLYVGTAGAVMFVISMIAAFSSRHTLPDYYHNPHSRIHPLKRRRHLKEERFPNESWKDNARVEGGIGALIAFAVTVYAFSLSLGIPHNNTDTARHYNQKTEFIVEDINNIPDSLNRLVDGAVPGTGDRSDCDLVGRYHVPSCIKQGEYPEAGWEPRTASWAAAKEILPNSSVGTSKTYLRTETLTYIHPRTPAGQPPAPGYWTGVRDGSGKGTPLYSVVEWSGKPNEMPTECKFDGVYGIDRALGGSQKNNLRNLIAEQFPQYPYVQSDIHGYCDRETPYDSEEHPNGAPVVIIPTYQEVRAGNHVERVPGVLLEVRGSESDEPDITPHYSVNEEDGILGPVYPLSIAAAQRDQVRWAAGRYAHKNGFGYDPLSAASQEGNNSEYFLQQADGSGNTAWVSPLSLRKNNSEVTVVDTVVEADRMTAGELNTLKVYTFEEGDPHRVDIALKVDRIKTRISDPDMLPGFTGDGGKIQEFTRTTGHGWRAFGTMGGTLKFLAEFDNNDDLTITLFDDKGRIITRDTQVAASDELCSQPVPNLTADELAACLKAA